MISGVSLFLFSFFASSLPRPWEENFSHSCERTGTRRTMIMWKWEGIRTNVKTIQLFNLPNQNSAVLSNDIIFIFTCFMHAYQADVERRKKYEKCEKSKFTTWDLSQTLTCFVTLISRCKLWRRIFCIFWMLETKTFFEELHVETPRVFIWKRFEIVSRCDKVSFQIKNFSWKENLSVVIWNHKIETQKFSNATNLKNFYDNFPMKIR